MLPYLVWLPDIQIPRTKKQLGIMAYSQSKPKGFQCLVLFASPTYNGFKGEETGWMSWSSSWSTKLLQSFIGCHHLLQTWMSITGIILQPTATLIPWSPWMYHLGSPFPGVWQDQYPESTAWKKQQLEGHLHATLQACSKCHLAEP